MTMWNCRDATDNNFESNARILQTAADPTVMFFTETRVANDSDERYAIYIPGGLAKAIPVVRDKGGFAVAWNPEMAGVKVL